MWDTAAPGKAKVHMWQLMRNGLATGTELLRRRIKAGVFCIACGREEDGYHRFWGCPDSLCFWIKLSSELGISVATPPRNIDSQSKLEKWLLEWFAQAEDLERSVMVQAVYTLWLARNEARDGRKITEPHELSTRVATYLNEWAEVHKKEARQREATVQQAWETPEDGWTKANVDGSLCKHRQKGGVGVVPRDHQGAFRVTSCQFLGAMVDPERVELLACKAAVQLATSVGTTQLHLESDSVRVIAMLKNEEKNLSTLGPIVEEVKAMLGAFVSFRISWVRRSANAAADRLRCRLPPRIAPPPPLVLRIHSPTKLTAPDHQPCSSPDPFSLDATTGAIAVPPPGLLRHAMQASPEVQRVAYPQRRLPPFASSPLPMAMLPSNRTSSSPVRLEHRGA
ncbi:uncharacterized protein [Aegilops tauschii subsp. strangulata]|uniref:uncharacterized protein n=1 Tax=Aegilops tauschii subsp. strangulata TaxID=200361 RepID=UPI003CC83FE7